MILSYILGMQSTGSASNKPDPCKEVCDINVKIADLGNACWTVSIPFEIRFCCTQCSVAPSHNGRVTYLLIAYLPPFLLAIKSIKICFRFNKFLNKNVFHIIFENLQFFNPLQYPRWQLPCACLVGI